MSEQLKDVSFDFIRYANSWEDADVLLKGLNPEPGAHIMAIASAGDNCFSLASTGAAKVVAVDISAVQLYLLELKREAIRRMDREEYLAFAGFKPSENRWENYQEFSHTLSDEAQAFWLERRLDLEQGIIHCGKFERYFQYFKQHYLHTVHSQERVEELFRTKSDEEQRAFHDEHWHTPEWVKLYRFYFGEQMMGDRGRDPEFLKYVEGPVADLILAQEVAHFRTARVQRNYMLQYILNNNFSTDLLPHYVRPENYQRVKDNLDAIVLHRGLIESALVQHPRCTHFYFSDIFEYMNVDLCQEVGGQIAAHTAPGARLLYWNLMLPRDLGSLLPEQFQSEKELAEQLNEEDPGYFYSTCVISERR